MWSSLWFPALMVFCAAVFGTLAIALLWEAFRDWSRRREVNRRLSPVMRGEIMRKAEELDLVRSEKEGRGMLAALARVVPGLEGTRKLLQQAKLDWTVESLLVMSAGAAIGLGAAAYLITQWTLVAAVAAVIGAFLPYTYAWHRRRRRIRAFEEQLPEAIDLLTRAIRAGHPLSAGIRMVAEEASPVVAGEFQQIFEEQRFGLPMQDALLGLVDRIDLVDVRIFVIAVLVQREVGGNLAEILENLAQTIRGRFYIRRQLRVYTAQGRLSGYVLAVLPIAVGLIMLGIQPDYIMTLFEHTLGKFLVATGATLQLIGFIWIRKIVNIEI